MKAGMGGRRPERGNDCRVGETACIHVYHLLRDDTLVNGYDIETAEIKLHFTNQNK